MLPDMLSSLVLAAVDVSWLPAALERLNPSFSLCVQRPALTSVPEDGDHQRLELNWEPDVVSPGRVLF